MTIRDDKIVYEILRNGGITLDVKTNTKLGLKHGYIVAIEGCERVVKTSVLSKQIIDRFIENNLTLLSCKGYYLGAWVDNGLVYLDVSKHSSKLVNAIWLANLENQIAIYDLENEITITL